MDVADFGRVRATKKRDLRDLTFACERGRFRPQDVEGSDWVASERHLECGVLVAFA
jgi:hypothetical protein